MLLIKGEDGQEFKFLDDLSELDNAEVFAWCDEAREDYCEAVIDGDDADWQQACADAVLTMAAEARRRGIRPGSVH